MICTADRVEHAEDMVSAFEEVLYHVRSAVEEVIGKNDSTCKDVVSMLNDVIDTIETERETYDDIIAEAEKRELAAMNRDYERSVL